MKKNTAILLFLSLFVACQSGPGKAEMSESINSLEKEIGAANTPPPDKIEALQTALIGYADAFPTDSLSVKYLSKAGETARLLHQYDKAFEIFDKIEKNYPSSKEAASAMFMKAFTLDNDMKKYDEAKPVYEAFIQKYPNDEFADDAQFLLKNLGKSPEEIIKGFEQKSE
ncbi:MAG: tetratricopeptide repeat protein [Bacteroidetes bacterium]|nr:tetratricopeptide repeat protein [Bacteroidota bacterium]